MQENITAKAFVCGDNITAYQIIAQKHWAVGLNPEQLGKWALEGACPAFREIPYAFRNLGFPVIVAGHDFGGGGKSIEHPVVALQGAGVKLMLAESFSRYCFRNAINLGLPAIVCPGVTKLANSGDELSVDLLTGRVSNLATGQSLQGSLLPERVLRFAQCGGMLAYYRKSKAD
jgi:3-isopropylmalate/(R)-2-methylmalate dehydratase small subunit